MMADIDGAIERQDAEALRRSAHTLKGAVRVFWAEPSTSTALELETRGRDGDVAGSHELYKRLQEEIGQLRAELRELLE